MKFAWYGWNSSFNWGYWSEVRWICLGPVVLELKRKNHK